MFNVLLSNVSLKPTFDPKHRWVLLADLLLICSSKCSLYVSPYVAPYVAHK